MRAGSMIAPPGGERRVYEDRDNPERLIKIAHEQLESAEFIKARFHLMKLLHLLFPKSIPDLQAAYSKPNTLVVERKRPSKKTLAGEKAEQKLLAELGSFGIVVDVFVGNFIEDKDGLRFYVDTVDPWIDMGTRLHPQYSETGLANAIQEKIQDPNARLKASFHLKRLTELLQAANQKREAELTRRKI